MGNGRSRSSQVTYHRRRASGMLMLSPAVHRPRLSGLAAMIQEEEVVRARREQLAHELDARGEDSTAIRRGLRGSRPVMGSLRLMRLQAIAERWRADAIPSTH